MEMVSKEWVFIVNPIAGNGFGKEIVPRLGEMIRKHNVDAEIVLTERSGHAAELSEQYYKRGFRYIIAVGGDGTFNEMCRPLINRKDITVGLVPAGTGNDFIQILGFPNRFGDPEWDIFFNRNSIEMDAAALGFELAAGHFDFQLKKLAVFLRLFGKLLFQFRNPLFVGAEAFEHGRLDGFEAAGQFGEFRRRLLLAGEQFAALAGQFLHNGVLERLNQVRLDAGLRGL